MGHGSNVAINTENHWNGGVEPMKVSYGKLMIWYFLISDTFTFVSFLVGYAASRMANLEYWPFPSEVFKTIPVPGFESIENAPLVFVSFMTFMLILSSVTMVLAVMEGFRMNKWGVIKYMIPTIIGGIILVSQGISLRYFKGASDIDLRNQPITHLLLYEAIKNAKAEGYKYFDFWGINHFAEIHDPVYNINHFKKGFGGYYTFFAKKMNISLIPNGLMLYRIFLQIKKYIFRIHLFEKRH